MPRIPLLILPFPPIPPFLPKPPAVPRLFTIETTAIRLTWSLQREEPPPVPQEATGPPFGLSVTPLHASADPTVDINKESPTHLFEETSYTVLLQSKGALDVRLRHRDPSLLRGLASENGIVHGALNFGSQVGRSRFEIVLEGVPHVAFEVEVFPSKLDYRRDYERLRADVQAVAGELAFAYLRATYTPARPLPERTAGALGWLALLRHGLDDLEDALRYIANHPLRSVRWERRPARAERIRRPDAALRRAMVQNGGFPEAQKNRAWLPGRQGAYALETPEHQWLAYELKHIGRQLAALREAEAAGRPSLRLEATLEELRELRQRVERLRRLVPGSAPTARPAPSLRLLRAPAYREAYRACLLLRSGLVVEGPALRLALKDLHELYEIWCFLTLVRLAAEEAGHTLPAHHLLRPERRGLHLRLRTGQAEAVVLRLGDGRRLTLTNNPRFSGADHLFPQQPDVLLSLHQPNGKATHAVLDAKYRLDASPGYRRRYGFPGPPTDALGDLHRYRDAIRIGGRQGVTQAVALFPYHLPTSSAWVASRHGRALRDLGIGAIPLLPGGTEPLRQWLRSFLDGKYAGAQGTATGGL